MVKRTPISKHAWMSLAPRGRSLFHDDAIDAIYQYTQGLPRVINVLCDHALLYAFSANKEQVSKKIVREVAVDMSLHQGQWPRRASTDTPDAGDEAMAGANHQADRIIIDYTKNYLGQGGATYLAPPRIIRAALPTGAMTGKTMQQAIGGEASGNLLV